MFHYFLTLRLCSTALTPQMPPGFDNFNPSCTQKSNHIPRLASVPHELKKTSALLLSSVLRITQLSVALISLLKFRHTYFTISAKTQLYRKD